MVHHLWCFFSPSSSAGTARGSSVVGEVGDLVAENSPRALSKEGLPSTGGVDENQPPGKNRELADVVDSYLARVLVDCVSVLKIAVTLRREA